jgi:uncharacterized membrane protein YhaH (DUF805 family)
MSYQQNSDSSIWTAEGRAGRATYFWTALVLAVFGLPAEMLLKQPNVPTPVIAVVALLMLVMAYVGLMVTIKRCHDRGHSGWLSLIGFVPFVNFALGIYLLFAKGSQAVNEYGPPGGGAETKTAGWSTPELAPAKWAPATAAVTPNPERIIPSERLSNAVPVTSAANALPPASQLDESLWAEAMREADGPHRRDGLWAKSFAEAGGDEGAAKAAYMRVRVAEIRAARDAESASRENERLSRLGKMERLAHLRAAQQKAACPNCAGIIPQQARECPLCIATFGPEARWKPQPISTVQPAETSLHTLEAAGFRVESVEGGWRITSGERVEAYAFSDADLAGLAALARRPKPLRLWFADLADADPVSTS